ncbi:hypothetical protein DDE05_32940 [Streptomyces cavourensis]|nr:hypothetical protein DDE05_32940 [Streptomyces cavourensis]
MFRSPESLAIALSWLYGAYIAFKCVAVVMHLGFAGDIGDWKEADFACGPMSRRWSGRRTP